MKQQLKETKAYLNAQGIEKAEIGIVLGSGLGKLVTEIDIIKEISYTEIPYFAISTVEFHEGKLIYGILEGKKVLVMQGRFHLYEGYTLQEITYPIRAMKELGINTLFVSNAAGAINLDYRKGEMMLIEDHINLQGGSPLAFKGVTDLGERFVDMSEPYDFELIKMVSEIASENNIAIRKGVYASVVGPQLETRAEYKMLKIIGADAVGMSSAPEVIVSNQLGIKTMAISVLTDECDPDNLEPIDIPEILRVVGETEPQMVLLFKELIRRL